MSFLDDLWERLFGADKKAGEYPDQAPDSGVSSCPLKTEPYIVRVVVKTRAGDIPVKGIKVKLDDAELGTSDEKGMIPDSPTRTKRTFKLTASYANDNERLKREEYALSVQDICIPGGSFSSSAANEIKKLRDVAGNRDDKNFLDMYTPSAQEVRYENAGGKHVIHVLIHLATLSLKVPYLNQNSQNDTLRTSAGHDPEGSGHDVRGDSSDGKFAGGVLCFASSTTMLLWYWGKNTITRREVMQKCYDLWADKNFEHRVGNGAVKSAEAPDDPAVGSYWLQTANPAPADGYTLKRYVQKKVWIPDSGDTPPDYQQATEPPDAAVGKIWQDTSQTPAVRKKRATEKEWQKVPEYNWRVMRLDEGAAFKIWTKWDYHKKAVAALKPDGTVLNDELDGTPIESLAASIELTGGSGTYAAAVANNLAKGYPSVFGTNATDFGHVMLVRGCVMDHTGKVQRLIVNDPFGTLESPKSMIHDYKINQSVGRDAVNNTEDVAEVQTVLQVLDYWSGEVDGNCDGTDEDELVKAIKKFQKKSFGTANPDGQIKPGGKTDKRLKKTKGKAGYSSLEKEPNGKGSGTADTTRGQHAYYDSDTKVPSGGLRLKGAWRGAAMLEKQPPLTPAELTNKLTPNA